MKLQLSLQRVNIRHTRAGDASAMKWVRVRVHVHQQQVVLLEDEVAVRTREHATAAALLAQLHGRLRLAHARLVAHVPRRVALHHVLGYHVFVDELLAAERTGEDLGSRTLRFATIQHRSFSCIHIHRIIQKYV